MKKRIELFLFVLFFCTNAFCQANIYTSSFLKTKASVLASAVLSQDLNCIEKLVKKDKDLLNFVDEYTGIGILSLALFENKYKSFELLLKLGCSPDFINKYTNLSVLIDAVKLAGYKNESGEKTRYIHLLLKYGAKPNYVAESTKAKRYKTFLGASTPLIEASKINIDLVKLLVANGADPYKKAGIQQRSPLAEPLRSCQIDIVNYFIDTLNVDIHKPLLIVHQIPTNKKVVYNVQDLLINDWIKAKLKNDYQEIDRLKKRLPKIEDIYKDRWELVMKLQNRGVDFINYNFHSN